MTWPGLPIWLPYVGLVAWLAREHYDPTDPKAGRLVVVVKVMRVERACVVMTRTSEVAAVRRGDVVHQSDAGLGCDRQGWWQPWRVRRVLVSAFDDEDTIIYTKLDDDTLACVMRAYEGLR